MCRYFPTEEVGPMSSRRMIPWTLAMAYCGFLIAGRGSRSFDQNTISEAVIGAVLGFLLAFLFTLRARRKQSELQHSAKSCMRVSLRHLIGCGCNLRCLPCTDVLVRRCQPIWTRAHNPCPSAHRHCFSLGPAINVRPANCCNQPIPLKTQPRRSAQSSRPLK